MLIVGYILVAVTINVKGEVLGTSLNYYMTNQNCYTAAKKQKELSEPGIGYVCIEDVLQ